MAIVGGQLAQARATTSAVSILSPGVGQEKWVKQIVIVNTSGAPCWIKIYWDEDGTTYDDTTIVFYGNITATVPFVYDVGLKIMGNAAGNLAIKAQTNDSLTVTVTGVTRT